MTIDKAIEILTQCVGTYDPDAHSEVKDAFKLGIEALKCVRTIRQGHIYNFSLTLRGETKD